MLGSKVTNKQTRHDPLLLEPSDTNKGTTHSDTLFVFLQLPSWLCVGMFWKRTIFCVSYTQIHVDVFAYSDNESWDSDSDVLTSSRKQLRSTGPLTPTISTPISPHIYQDHFCKSVRLVQALLDRNVSMALGGLTRAFHVT
jgi:hypothetical protein